MNLELLIRLGQRVIHVDDEKEIEVELWIEDEEDE